MAGARFPTKRKKSRKRFVLVENLKILFASPDIMRYECQLKTSLQARQATSTNRHWNKFSSTRTNTQLAPKMSSSSEGSTYSVTTLATNRDIDSNFMMVDSEDKENHPRREDRADEYDTAVLRALTENAYVKKVNSQLITKLHTITSDSSVATDASGFKSSRRTEDKIVTFAKLEALENKQRSMDEMVTALRESLDVACRERDDANAKVAALLFAVEEPVNLVNDVWERNAARSWEKKYNESSKQLVEVMYERDRLKIKYDEMQGMKGVETVFISRKKEDWETRSEELAKQLDQVTFERNCLRDEISRLGFEKEDSEKFVAEKVSMEKVIANLTKQVDGHLVTERSMQSKIDSLQSTVAAIKLAKNVEVEYLRQELASASASLVDITSQKDCLAIEQASLKEQTLALQVDITEMQASREHEVRSLQDELQTAQASLSNANAQARKHSVEFEALNTQIKITNESLNATRVENHKMSEDLRTHRATWTQSLSDWKKRLDCVEANNESLACERDDLKLDNCTLQHQLQNLQSYVSEITAYQEHQVETAENSIEVVSSTYVQHAEKQYLLKERNELMSKNDALKQKNETLQRQLFEVTAGGDSASEAFKRLIGGLRMQLGEQEKIAEISTQQLQDFKVEASREQGQLKSKIVLLEDDLLRSQQKEEKLRIDNQSSTEEQEQLKSKIAVLEIQLLQSEQKEYRLRSALSSLEGRIAELSAHSEQEHAGFEADRKSLSLALDANMEKANLEQERLKSKITSLEEELHQSKQEEERLQSFVVSMDKRRAEALASLESEKAGLESQIKSLSMTVDAVKEMANREQAQLHSKVEILEEDLRKAMLNSISDANRDRDQAMSKVEGLSDELKSTAIALSQVQEFISKDKMQAEETQQQLRSLEAEKKLLEEKIVSVKNDADNMNKQLEFSRQEAEGFRRKWESSESVAESMTNRCFLIEAEVEASKLVVLQLNEKLVSSESLTKAAEDQCDQLRSCIAELSTKCDEADALMNALQLETQRSIASCRQEEERNNSKIHSLENMIASLTAEYKAFKVEAEAAAVAQLRSCEAKLASLCAGDGNNCDQSQEYTFDDMIARLAQEHSILAEKYTSTAKQLDAAQKKISALELAITTLRKVHEAFKLEADATATTQMKSYEASLESIQNELSNKVNELELAQNEKVALKQEVCMLSTQASKFKLQNKGLLKAMDQLTKHM